MLDLITCNVSPVIPNYWNTVFQPCLPTFLPAGEVCSLLLSLTDAGSVLSPSCWNVPTLCSASLGHGAACPDHLQGPSGITQFPRNIGGGCWKLVTATSESCRPGFPIPAFGLLTGVREIFPSIPGWQRCRFGNFVSKITLLWHTMQAISVKILTMHSESPLLLWGDRSLSINCHQLIAFLLKFILSLLPCLCFLVAVGKQLQSK